MKGLGVAESRGWRRPDPRGAHSAGPEILPPVSAVSPGPAVPSRPPVPSFLLSGHIGCVVCCLPMQVLLGSHDWMCHALRL